jgi:putative transcriptional regulator
MSRLFRPLFVVLALGVFIPSATTLGNDAPKGSSYLIGKLLVATPDLLDPYFSKSVVLLIDHNTDGAFGLIVNRPYGRGSLKEFLQGFGIDSKTADGEISMRFGGPVERGHMLIVHSTDYAIDGTVKVGSDLAVTNQNDVLQDLAVGAGPKLRMVILGYAGWAAQQLENEIARGDWTSMSADHDLVFSDDIETIWERARARSGMPL